MSFVISQPADFFVFNLYNAIGFENMYIIPRHAQESGVLFFLGAYAVILLLIGIPAFAEESSNFMTTDDFSDEGNNRGQERWSRVYRAIMLMQNMQSYVAEAYRQFGIAIVQLFALLYRSNFNVLKLLTSKCSTIADIAIGAGTNSEQLQPSCLVLQSSRLACEMLSLFYNPNNLLYYSIIMISIIMPAYALSFGKTSTVYCTIGRLYMALIVLCSCTLLLHFFDAPKTHKEAEMLTRIGKEPLNSDAIPKVLETCMRSLGLASFSVSVIGASAGAGVKRNFVFLTAAICLCDLFVSAIFTAVNVMRRSSVQALCQFNGTEAMQQFMYPVTLGKEQQRMDTISRLGIMEMGESIMLFREYSGYIPWTVYLPFQMLMLIFSTLLVCNYFFVCDLQASRTFNGRSWCVVSMAVLRFGLLIAMDFMSVSGLCADADLYLKMGVNMTFFLLKSVECIFVHMGKGFAHYIHEKRHLIPEENSVQLFFFNWYMAPGIIYLFNFGYPLLCAIYVIAYSDFILTAKFGIYFVTVNLVSVLISLILPSLPSR